MHLGTKSYLSPRGNGKGMICPVCRNGMIEVFIGERWYLHCERCQSFIPIDEPEFEPKASEQELW